MLDEMLRQISTVQADAIRLRFFGELTFEEIAEAMQSSLSGAKKRVKQGLMTLAEKIRESEGSES